MATLAALSKSPSALVNYATLGHVIIPPPFISPKSASALCAMPSWPSPNPPGAGGGHGSVGYPHR